MAAFDRCVLNSDVSLADDVLDDEYSLVLVQPAPASMSRARWLEVLPSYEVHDYEIEEQAVDVIGDVAAVLQRVRMSATVLGEDRSGVFVISDVWRRRGDRWLVWRRHSTPLTAGNMPGSET